MTSFQGEGGRRCPPLPTLTSFQGEGGKMEAHFRGKAQYDLLTEGGGKFKEVPPCNPPAPPHLGPRLQVLLGLSHCAQAEEDGGHDHIGHGVGRASQEAGEGE